MINITFSKFVKMSGRLWEVNFRKLARGNNLFYADTATLQGERIQFQMQKTDEGQWTLTGNQLPAWLYESVSSLGAAIDLGMTEYFPNPSASKLEQSSY